jgi:hypothetical protein
VPGQDHRPLPRIAAQGGGEIRPSLQGDGAQHGFIAAHARQIGRDHVMPGRSQGIRDMIEAPAAMPGTVDQDEGGHQRAPVITTLPKRSGEA